MKNTIYITIVFLLIFTSCKDPKTGSPIGKHTALVYMIADNSLSDISKINIDQIERGLQKTANTRSTIYVYCDNKDSKPELLKISKSKNKTITETIQTYSEYNSASKERLTEVIKLFKDNELTADSRELILWSHATGWMPPNFKYNDTFLSTYSFGDDDGKEMTITDLANSIPDNFFKSITFDACLMGGIEVAYQLRNKAEYILAGSSLTPASGIPYEEIIPMLLDDNKDFYKIANICYNHFFYLRKTAFGAIKTTKLEELASITKNIFDKHKSETLTSKNIQSLENLFDSLKIFFDFADFIKSFATQAEFDLFKQKLDDVVIFAKSPDIVDGIQIKTYCGLSTYIQGQNNELDAYYKTTDWYNRVFK